LTSGENEQLSNVDVRGAEGAPLTQGGREGTDDSVYGSRMRAEPSRWEGGERWCGRKIQRTYDDLLCNILRRERGEACIDGGCFGLIAPEPDEGEIGLHPAWSDRNINANEQQHVSSRYKRQRSEARRMKRSSSDMKMGVDSSSREGRRGEGQVKVAERETYIPGWISETLMLGYSTSSFSSE
jgi:hypothetical protein